VTFLEHVRAAVAGLLGRIGLNGSEAAAGAAVFVISFFGSIALTGAVLVRLPPDFLTNDAPRASLHRSFRAYALRLLRHTLGVLLILIGIILSLPGVPGQGILTILAGLIVAELPVTNRLLQRILRSPRVLSAVNKLRARYKHPPLLAPQPPGPSEPSGPPATQ
jgi:hypothetical protein